MNINSFQAKWRRPLYNIALIMAIICALKMIAMYFIPFLRHGMINNLRMYRIFYIYLPIFLNAIAAIITHLRLKSTWAAPSQKNTAVCLFLLWISISIEISFGYYPAALCVPALVIVISSVFADLRLTHIMTVIAIVTTIGSYFVTGHPQSDDKFSDIYNVVIACLVILFSAICTHIITRYICDQLESVGKGEKTERELLKQMRLDPLTGLYNRAGMDQILDDLISTFTGDYPMTLLMIDIDNFKKTNDTYGHQCGDDVLRRLSRLILGLGRRDIIPCRFGGEEIVIVFKNHTAEEALKKASNILVNFEAQTFDFDTTVHMTFSGGLCELERNMTKDAWIECADAAMYSVKKNGKNRVKIYDSFQDVKNVENHRDK